MIHAHSEDELRRIEAASMNAFAADCRRTQEDALSSGAVGRTKGMMDLEIFEIPAMRYKKYEITDLDWMEAVIREARYATLALATPDGFPYAVPIGYGYERGAFYFHGSKEGFKQLILASNPRACVNLHAGDELVPGVPSSQYNTRYRSVTAFGKIETITDRASINHGLATMMSHYDAPHEDVDDGYFIRTWVGKLVVEKMTGKQAGGAAYYSVDETAKIIERMGGPGLR